MHFLLPLGFVAFLGLVLAHPTSQQHLWTPEHLHKVFKRSIQDADSVDCEAKAGSDQMSCEKWIACSLKQDLKAQVADVNIDLDNMHRMDPNQIAAMITTIYPIVTSTACSKVRDDDFMRMTYRKCNLLGQTIAVAMTATEMRYICNNLDTITADSLVCMVNKLKDLINNMQKTGTRTPPCLAGCRSEFDRSTTRKYQVPSELDMLISAFKQKSDTYCTVYTCAEACVATEFASCFDSSPTDKIHDMMAILLEYMPLSHNVDTCEVWYKEPQFWEDLYTQADDDAWWF